MDGDKLPYVIVLALSALAWGAGHFYDTVVKAPIIEYTINDLKVTTGRPGGDPYRHVTVMVKNATSETLFDAVVVWIRPTQRYPKLFSSIDVTTLDHGYPGNAQGTAFVESASAEIAEVQPRITYRVDAEYRGTEPAHVYFHSPSKAVRFEERGILTLAVTHAEDVIVWAVIGLPISLATYFIVKLLVCLLAPRCKPIDSAQNAPSDGGWT